METGVDLHGFMGQGKARQRRQTDFSQCLSFDKTNWSDESFPLLETLSAELHDILIVTYLYCHAVSPCCAGQARCLSLIQSLIAHSIAAVPRPDAPRIISPVPLPLPPPGRPTTTRPSHLNIVAALHPSLLPHTLSQTSLAKSPRL